MQLPEILAAVGLTAVGAAHPTKESNKALFSRGVANLDAFRLPMLANYTSAEMAISKRDAAPSSSDPIEVAKAHLKDKSGGASFRLVDDHYKGSNGITHIHFKQTFHDIDVDNADYNVNVSCPDHLTLKLSLC